MSVKKQTNKDDLNGANNKKVAEHRNVIKIVLKSFDDSLCDAGAKRIVSMAKQERVKFKGPIPLPSDEQHWTVLKSVHIDKTARNQYFQKTSKRLIIIEADNNFVELMSKMILPLGVDVKISLGDGAI